jgi:hypothetical protein
VKGAKIMQIKVKINKNGSLRDYINLPVLDKTVKGFGFSQNSEEGANTIGVITDAQEVDGQYELTATVWDKFVEKNTELYGSGKVAAVSFGFKQST